MKSICAAVAMCAASIQAAEMPELLASCFSDDKPIPAEVVAVIPPPAFEEFVQKLSAVSQKDPEWFAEHMKKTPGSPMPAYDPKLEMTQEEYDAYAKLWDSREAKKIENTTLLVREIRPGKWQISGTGVVSLLSLVVFDAETEQFISPNGAMERIGDIDAPKRSLLGEWKGYEWRFQSENSLTKMKENMAFGTTTDGKYHLLIYRLQEVTSRGKPLLDDSMVIRFAASQKAKKK
ncbi:hypothetical protein [Rubritalea marina]|uniref:hypothetical protein n=1 Tax=Rubritalea marina TaxID=361055 RepID=UPI0012EA25B6|nr:hypothetical protein [Rubritalea marina]